MRKNIDFPKQAIDVEYIYNPFATCIYIKITFAI